MNEQNMNPEQIRQAALFQERENLTRKGYKMHQEPTPAEIKDRQKAYRAEVLRNFIRKNYPNETKAEQEAHLRLLLGDPEPVKKAPAKPAKKPALAPIRKSAPAKTVKRQPEPAKIHAIWENVNRRIAAQYGIKEPGEIIYR